MPPLEDRLVARALAKLTKEAARAGRDLAALRDDAEVVPMEIRIQLNHAIEEIDLLSHRLPLMRVVRKSDAA
jgi:hypothetical protein